MALLIDTTNKHAWHAVSAVIDAALQGINQVTLDSGSLSVSYNSTSQGKAVDFTQTAVTISTGGGAGSDVTLDAADAVAEGSATGATVNLFDVVKGTADLTFKRDTVDAELNGDGEITLADGDLNDAKLLTFSLSHPTLTIGSSGYGV